MADVFLSYASEDRNSAGAIAAALEREGLSVWWDRALVGGDRYAREIDEAIAGAKAVIVLWSPAAAESDWVLAEVEEPRKRRRIIPVLIKACRIPRPYNILHTIDLTRWSGDRGNDGFPELVEAAKATKEGRPAQRIPFRRRLTLIGVIGSIIAALGVIASITDIIDTAMRWTAPGAFAERSADSLSAGDAASPETQEGFREALASLARSADLRTQRALDTMENGSRADALNALHTLALDQSGAIDSQIARTASLWRQIGLLRFNEDPRAAREALELARRYAPTDIDTLTALGALYQREGRIAEADEAYRAVMAQGALSASAEGRVRQVIGQASLERSDASAAEREFTRALALAQQSVDEMLEADLYIDFGLLEIDRGNYAGARRRFAEARAFALSFDYAPSVAFADYNTAESFLLEGQLDQAERLLASTRSQAEALNERYLLLFIDLAAGRIAASRGDHRRALDIANGVRERAAVAGMRRPELEAVMLAGEVQLSLGEADAAEQNARTAREGWRRLRAAGAGDVAAVLEAAAASRDAGRRQEACSALAVIAPPPGHAQREAARLARLSGCSS